MRLFYPVNPAFCGDWRMSVLENWYLAKMTIHLDDGYGKSCLIVVGWSLFHRISDDSRIFIIVDY